MSGDTGEIEGVYDGMKEGRPTIVLQHSGKMADFFALVHKSITVAGCTTPDSVVAHMQQEHKFWAPEGKPDSIYDVHNLKFTMHKYISGLLELNRTAPAQMRDLSVVLDMWRDSPETVLQTLSGCFAAISNSMFELGAGNAEVECVMRAMEQLDDLKLNAKSFRNWSHMLNAVGLILSFLSTLTAVTNTYIKANGDHIPWMKNFDTTDSGRAFRLVATILPALAGLFITLLSRLRYVEKWAKLHVAASKLESEIYVFRVKAGDYDIMSTHSGSSANSTGKQRRSGGSASSASLQRRARALFAQRASEVFAGAMSDHLGGDTLATSGNWQPVDSVKSDDAMIEKCRALSTEEYVRKRLVVQRRDFQKLAPHLARLVTILEFWIFAASVFGTVLAATQQDEWVPVSVAFGSLLSAFMSFLSLHVRLTAINSSIADMLGLETRWSSLGVVEKRMRSVKDLFVEVCESAILREASACAAGAAATAVQMKDSRRGDAKKHGEGTEKDSAETEPRKNK